MRANWIEIAEKSRVHAFREGFYFDARRRGSKRDRWDWETYVEVDCSHCCGMCTDRHTIGRGMVEGREMMERMLLAFQSTTDVLIVMGQVEFKPL
jgi:hypothetical protein